MKPPNGHFHSGAFHQKINQSNPIKTISVYVESFCLK